MIDLTYLKCAGAQPFMLDWGATLEPALGGVSQRIDRLGTRFGITISTPPMRVEADGRKAIALLQQARRQGARVAYPQVDLKIGLPGSPQVNGAHTGGMSLTIKGANPGYAIKLGQALNIDVSGRSYLYFAAAPVALNGSGNGTVTLTTPMRTHLAGNESINLKAPVIEGWIEGDQVGWTLDIARTVGLEFTVRERA